MNTSIAVPTSSESQPTSVEIVEVGPRDGLQDEHVVVPTEGKLAYIRAAVRAGVKRLEVASFANPKRVPQMADAEAVIAGLDRSPGVSYIGLVLNAPPGMDRAIASGIDEVNAVVIVTDTFSQRNQGMPTEAAIGMWADVAARAHDAGIKAGVTLSAAFGCPYEGVVDPDRVVEIAKRVAAAGADEISLADSIGCAVPTQTALLTRRVREATQLPIRIHLHNSRNAGYANAVAAIAAGATTLDSSLAGLGGCPFAPGATGNVATEDLVNMLTGMGIDTGIDVALLLDGVAVVEQLVGHQGSGMLARAGLFPDDRTRCD